MGLNTQVSLFHCSQQLERVIESGLHHERAEDIAYCLLGIFEVNLPLIYGEGHRAFTRLQEIIIRTSTDHSIFAWNVPEDKYIQRSRTGSKAPIAFPTNLLASSPADFALGPEGEVDECYHRVEGWVQPYEITNLGIRMCLPLIPCSVEVGYCHAILNCKFRGNDVCPIALTLWHPQRDVTDQPQPQGIVKLSCSAPARSSVDYKRCSTYHM